MQLTCNPTISVRRCLAGPSMWFHAQSWLSRAVDFDLSKPPFYQHSTEDLPQTVRPPSYPTIFPLPKPTVQKVRCHCKCRPAYVLTVLQSNQFRRLLTNGDLHNQGAIYQTWFWQTKGSPCLSGIEMSKTHEGKIANPPHNGWKCRGVEDETKDKTYNTNKHMTHDSQTQMHCRWGNGARQRCWQMYG